MACGSVGTSQDNSYIASTILKHDTEAFGETGWRDRDSLECRQFCSRYDFNFGNDGSLSFLSGTYEQKRLEKLMGRIS